MLQVGDRVSVISKLRMEGVIKVIYKGRVLVILSSMQPLWVNYCDLKKVGI